MCGLFFISLIKAAPCEVSVDVWSKIWPRMQRLLRLFSISKKNLLGENAMRGFDQRCNDVMLRSGIKWCEPGCRLAESLVGESGAVKRLRWLPLERDLGLWPRVKIVHGQSGTACNVNPASFRSPRVHIRIAASQPAICCAGPSPLTISNRHCRDPVRAVT